MKYNKRIVDKYASLDPLLIYRNVFVFDMSANIYISYPHLTDRVPYHMGNRKRRLVEQWKDLFRDYQAWKDVDFQ